MSAQPRRRGGEERSTAVARAQPGADQHRGAVGGAGGGDAGGRPVALGRSRAQRRREGGGRTVLGGGARGAVTAVSRCVEVPAEFGADRGAAVEHRVEPVERGGKRAAGDELFQETDVGAGAGHRAVVGAAHAHEGVDVEHQGGMAETQRHQWRQSREARGAGFARIAAPSLRVDTVRGERFQEQERGLAPAGEFRPVAAAVGRARGAQKGAPDRPSEAVDERERGGGRARRHHRVGIGDAPAGDNLGRRLAKARAMT